MSIFCKIGFHRWEYLTYAGMKLIKTLFMTSHYAESRKCSRCGKFQTKIPSGGPEGFQWIDWCE